MLTLFDVDRRGGRRDFLRVGSLALGGLSLGSLLNVQAHAASSRMTRDRSVVFLFLHGGPPQTETFDPKMTALAGVRSVTGETATTIPGVTFGSSFQRLAKLAKHLSVVRSYRPGDANHDIKPLVSKETNGAGLGALYARTAGTHHPVHGFPTTALLFPRAVDPSTQPGTNNFGKFNSTGTLGGAYAPFEPGSGGQLQSDLQLNVPLTRLADRRLLMQQLSGLQRQWEQTGGLGALDRMREQAFSAILGGAAEAFDLSRESTETLKRYDTAPLVTPTQINRHWNNYNNYVDNAKSLGKLLLLSRRLCEAGAGFVTVTTNFVWDFHADTNNCGVEEGMRYCGEPLDFAVSAFLEDVAARGLSDKILLVVCGEIGRTPKLNAKGGRDHWGNLAPLLLAGGGIPGGQVIGQSTKDVSEPATTPVTSADLVSLVLGQTLDLSQVRVARGIPDDVHKAAFGGRPISQW